jgi:hypothetical protein
MRKEMTEEILTQVQRLSLDKLPDSLSSEDLSQYFTLSPHEISEAKANRGAENQVGFPFRKIRLSSWAL